MIPGSALFIGLPLALSVGVYLLRRWAPAQAIVAASASGGLALAALLLPVAPGERGLGGLIEMSRAVSVLGRAFTFDTADRPAIAFMFLVATVLFAAALAVPVPRDYLPVGLAWLGLMAAALFIKPFLFAALFLEMTAASAAFMLCDEEHRATRGAARLLAFVTMGVPFILLTGWLVEGYEISPGNVAVLGRATALLGAGFAILLAVVPFHSWIPALARDAAPLAAAFVLSVLPTVMLLFLFDFLNEYDWLRLNPDVFRWLAWAGLAMAAVGGAFAFAQRAFGPLMGYAFVADIGASLLAVGLGPGVGVQTALALLAGRVAGLAVWALGLTYLRAGAGGDDFEQARGLARRRPLTAAAVVLGGLALVGFPATVGFPARWALYRLLAAQNEAGAWVLLLSTISVALAYARGLSALIARTPSDLPAEDRLARLYLGIGVLVILFLGAFPQFLLPAIVGAAEAFVHLQ